MNKRLFPVFLGTVVEYYDYALYGFSANILSRHYFSNLSNSKGLLLTFLIFAVGYLAKPLGALVFGIIGDKYGRKVSLSLTIIGIGIPTSIIGVIPSYEKIGYLSSLILLTCRFTQGFFAGGEYDGAAIHILETIGKNKSAIGSSICRAMGVCGLLLGSLSVYYFNSHLFSSEYGWRIPFLLAAPVTILASLGRKKLAESNSFRNHSKNNSYNDFSSLIQKQWKKILLVCFLSGSIGGMYQFVFVFIKNFLPHVSPEVSERFSNMHPILLIIFGLSMVASGFIADRHGVRKTMVASSIISLLLSSTLILNLTNSNWNFLFANIILLVIFIAPGNCLLHALIYEVFSVRERYRGVSIGHSLGSMSISGATPFFAMLAFNTSTSTVTPFLFFGLLSVTSVIFINLISYKSNSHINLGKISRKGYSLT